MFSRCSTVLIDRWTLDTLETVAGHPLAPNSIIMVTTSILLLLFPVTAMATHLKAMPYRVGLNFFMDYGKDGERPSLRDQFEDVSRNLYAVGVRQLTKSDITWDAVHSDRWAKWDGPE